jgi:unsaturated rhamnogalacturonyl hydrolase
MSQACIHAGAVVESNGSPPVPTGKRPPCGWRAVGISPTDISPVVLRWSDLPDRTVATHLRVTIAIDLKGERMVEAVLASSGRQLGRFDVRNASVLQPCEIPLPPDDLPAIRREGIALRVAAGDGPLWILAGGQDLDPVHAPHLLVPGTLHPLAEFHARIASLGSLQPFGWMGGCVLDGLLDLGERPDGKAALAAAQRQLGMFIRGDHLIYEGPASDPCDDRIDTIEGTLPFAALARLHPGHALLDLAVQWWQREPDADGAVIDWISTTSEGSYTVAYPMALIARQRNDEALERMAATQIRLRQQRLVASDGFWRLSRSNGTRANREWARGIAWHLLGGMRTLAVLHDRPSGDGLAQGLVELAARMQGMQRADGLWSVFVDEPALVQDTAGSAGIAAALALGARLGLLPVSARESARRCLAGLVCHLTADGLLGGVSASNKGGEDLQRGAYRVIYPMGMGLMGQLIAAIDG